MAEAIKKKQVKSRNKLGLDIGNHSIKMVELSGVSEKPGLVTFGLKKITGSSQDAASLAIKALAGELGVSSKDVNISVSGPSLIVRLISMPRMTDEELASAVRFETEKFIPFDINDCILDFQILNKAAKDSGNADILLAAAKKEYVLQKIKSAEEAGFSVKAVDVDIFAVVNSFLRNHPSLDRSKTFAILNIGALATELSILLEDRPVFVREVAMGSNELVLAVAKKTGLTPEQSEELMLSPKERFDEVVGHAKAAINNLLDEVRLSFGYYENQSGRGVDEICLSGGGSKIAGLEEAFYETFGSRPRSWDPFQCLDKSASLVDNDILEKMKQSFCVAVGLALRG